MANDQVIRRANLAVGAIVSVCLAWAAIPYISFNVQQAKMETIKVALDSDKVLIFIHGWSGGATAWKRISRFAFDDPRLAKFDIYAINYPTHLRPRSFTLSELAIWVANAIGEVAHNKKVYIVAHSLGGVVARKVALLRILGSSHEIAVIVTIGSPHAGADYAKLATALGVSNQIVQDIVPSSSFMRGIFTDWQSVLASRQVRPRFLCLASAVDEIVTVTSAHTQCDGEPISYLKWQHTELLAPDGPDDDRYRLPLGYILRDQAALPPWH